MSKDNRNAYDLNFLEGKQTSETINCLKHPDFSIENNNTIFNRFTFKSPDIFAPAVIPVAAGKKTANIEKKSSFSVNCGPKFSINNVTKKKVKKLFYI